MFRVTVHQLNFIIFNRYFNFNQQGFVLLLQKQQEGKMQLQKSINRWLPDEKMMVLEKESDALLVLRKVGSQKLRNIIQRDRRPHLLAEQVEFIPENEV